MKRWGWLLLCLSLLATGCNYEGQVTRVARELSTRPCHEAGTLKLSLVQEYRKPRGLATFPDGGVPLYLAQYILVEREGQEVGRISFPFVRRNDFGNFNGGKLECQPPNRLLYRLEHGYGEFGPNSVVEGELEIPLPGK